MAALTVSVDDQLGALAAHGAHRHAVDLRVIVRRRQVADVAVDEARHAHVVGLDLRHTEGGVGALRACLARGAGHRADLGVELRDHIGLLILAQAGKVDHADLVDDCAEGRVAAADVAAHAGGLGERGGRERDGLADLRSLKLDLAALAQDLRALERLVLRLARRLGLLQELTVLLVDEGLDLGDLGVEVADLGHFALVILALARLEQALGLREHAGALRQQVVVLSTHCVPP